MSEYNSKKDELKVAFSNLQEVVDKISELLHCPVTLEDETHRLITYSKHDIHTDPARLETIISRQVPFKVTQRLWKQGIIQKLNESSQPIRIKAIQDIGLGNRVAISIRQKDDVLGYIWVIEMENTLDTVGFEILTEAAQTLRMFLLKHRLQQRKETEGQQRFFWRLLNKSNQKKEDIISGFNKLQVDIPERFSIAIFRFSTRITARQEQQFITYLHANHDIEMVFYHIDQYDFTLLLSPKHSQITLQKLPHLIEDIVHSFSEKEKKPIKVIGGCSHLFTKIERIDKAYHEALTVVDLKETYASELTSVNGYWELGVFKYLDILIDRKTEEESMDCFPIRFLTDYDEKNQTNLLETLEVFLNTDGNVNEASKELHVHPNTLNYRMKRIVELTGIKYKDPKVKIDLYLEFKIRKWMGK
ncbi:PucR family transcriptional regulator [Alkalihalobacterium alkalinitrilicum]|uniref:PucR family transcriptional regulator n=1 Tax=Alkalihalobacterium alkalinitrilicum TaxID=427920 RepID=UPI0009956AB1|nr:helix-turn-helix domain-containing protein [Alkalihalobacterium alkalinitrilicum]